MQPERRHTIIVPDNDPQPAEEQSQTQVENKPEQTHNIDKILASQYYRGEKLYKVKWTGIKGTTWEHKTSIPQKMINDFHITCTAKGRKRKRPLKYFVQANPED